MCHFESSSVLLLLLLLLFTTIRRYDWLSWFRPSDIGSRC
jgi:hypothetical protein